jgi:hypothetical protein
MMRGGPDQSGGDGRVACGVNDKVARGRGGVATCGANRLGAHRGSVGRLVGLDHWVGPSARVMNSGALYINDLVSHVKWLSYSTPVFVLVRMTGCLE